jgi:hypothetical protein
MKITANIKRKIFELEKEYKIADLYKKAKGETPQEKITNMYIESTYGNQDDKLRMMEFNLKVYALIKNMKDEEVEEIDYTEVQKEVAKFR